MGKKILVGYYYLLYANIIPLYSENSEYRNTIYSYLLQGGSAHRVQEPVSEVRENESWKRVHKGADTILLGRG